MTSIIKLLKNEIHVYLYDVSEKLNRNANFKLLLDESEQARAKKFRLEKHQHRFINIHATLREILIKYVGHNPQIVKTEYGKPWLKDYPSLQFNLSHSENKVICAINLHSPIGIDIECQFQYRHPPKPIDYLGIAERFFSPAEFQSISAAANSENEFLTLWTRKEAYLKAIGSGLMQGLDKSIPENFEIHDFIPCKGYTAALVVDTTSEISKTETDVKKIQQKQLKFFEY